MSGSLNNDQVAQFQRDGLLFPLRVMSAQQAAGYRQRLEAAEALGGPIVERRAFKLHLLYPFLYELAAHPALLDAVEGVLGPNLLVYAAGLFIKEPHTTGYVAWHQDQVHYGLEPEELVTAWLALGDVDVANGCMKLLPGSHTRSLWKHEDAYTKGNVLSRGEEIRVDVDASQAVDVVLGAGEISLHHLLTVHGSPGNGSDRRRIGFAIRYIAAHVQHRGGRRDGALLVRGRDTHGYWDLEQPPTSATDPATLARYEAAMASRERIYFEGAAPPKGRDNTGLRGDY